MSFFCLSQTCCLRSIGIRHDLGSDATGAPGGLNLTDHGSPIGRFACAKIVTGGMTMAAVHTGHLLNCALFINCSRFLAGDSKRPSYGSLSNAITTGSNRDKLYTAPSLCRPRLGQSQITRAQHQSNLRFCYGPCKPSRLKAINGCRVKRTAHIT